MSAARLAFEARLWCQGLWLAAWDCGIAGAVVVLVLVTGYPVMLVTACLMAHWLLGTRL